MATRRLFWKWHIWKSIGFFPYTRVMCYWSLDLIFKAKQKLESGNRKIHDGGQAAILKVTSLKINRLLPMATNNMHMEFQIEIPKQTWVTLRKPCRLQTDGQTNRQTDRQDRQTDRRTRWFQYQYHLVGRGYNKVLCTGRHPKQEVVKTSAVTCTAHISHNVTITLTEMCTLACVHFCYKSSALWDICLMHCGICGTGRQFWGITAIVMCHKTDIYLSR